MEEYNWRKLILRSMIVKYLMNFTYKIQRAWSEYRRELFYGIWAVPIVLIVRLMRPLIHIRFGKLRADRIGHYVYEYALMIAESELNNNKTIDLLYTHYPLCNEQLNKMIRRRSFVRNWVKYLFLWNKGIPFGEKHNVQNNIDLDSRDLGGWLEKSNVYFHKREKQRAKKRKALITGS